MKNSKKSWLYIPVEVKVRELDAKLLLSYYAALHGHRVVIGEHRMVELAALHYPNGVFFSKGYPNRFRNRIVTTAVNRGHQVVELDEEGLIIHDRMEYLHDRMRADVLQMISQQYCWGSQQKDIITQGLKRKKKNCFITGNPRFDLLRQKFRPLYDKEVARLQQKYGPFILINTRFSRYNSIVGKKTNDEHAKYIKSLFDHFIVMIEHVAKQFPNTNIIIRPHPGENLNTYKKLFSSYENVHVIHEGNIVKWLIAASVIIHNGCTSSIEAFLLKKPIISFIPITSKTFDVHLPNSLGIKATNHEDIIELLKNIPNIKLSDREYKNLLYKLNDYCKWSSDYSATDSIVSLLSSLKVPRTNFPSTRKLLHLKSHKYVAHFFPSLHRKEIETFFHQLNKIENQKQRFLIKNIGKNAFCIEKSP